MATSRAASNAFLTSRRGRIFVENLTAYLFLLPAAVLIFLFGIFPVGFAFFVSLHNWRRFPGDYLGLQNYTKALGDLGYLLFFFIGAGMLIYTAFLLLRLWREHHTQPRRFVMFLPGIVNAVAIFLFLDWFFTLLPVVLDIPQRIRGQDRVEGIFVQQFFESFQFPEVIAAGNLMLVAILAAVALSVLFARSSRDFGRVLLQTTTLCVIAGLSFFVFQLTFSQIQLAVESARAEGTELPIWSQIVLMSSGVALVVAAYFLWRRAHKSFNNSTMILQGLAALLLLIGGYLLIAELPRLLAESDEDLLHGFNITVMFAAGTVPAQLALGMVLAYMLFQDIRWKSFFRIVYFLPYITPFVATSIVFSILFSNRPESLVNQAIGMVGIPPQTWLLQPIGINKLIFGAGVPDFLAGPGLALVVIMVYSIWTYVGYDAVVFLAGLGNIGAELYEAARIDGASRWHEFRYITFPLLSPTTFFLTLIAVIGTFKAFIQIWIMRQPSAYGAVDTASVYIFETVRGQVPQMGYGSAMAFVLFGIILLLTIFQNRFLGSKVVYD